MSRHYCNLKVEVINRDVEKAIKRLRKKCQKDGILKESKSRRYYDKPSIKKRKKRREAEIQRKKDELESLENNDDFIF